MSPEATQAAEPAKARYGYDIIDLETARYGLIEIARDMHETLMRGGFSPIVRDIRDCTAAVHMRTENGWEMVASWEGCLQHAFTSQHIVNFTMTEWDESILREGDVIMVNDPWRGSIHQADINLLSPVLIDGTAEFILHTTAHIIDLGGAHPGGFANGAATMFEEPLKFPPTLFYAAGVPVRPAFNYLLENNRVPQMVLGDVRALAGALNVGSRRLHSFLDRHGLEKAKAGAHYGMDLAEAGMRAGLAQLEDGDYRVDDILDDDSITADAIPLTMTLRVRGNRAEIDWSGTGRQARGNTGTAWIEATRPIIGAKYVLDPHSPVNSGTYRPFDALLPPGSAVCVLPPSSLSNHSDLGCRSVNMMTQALGKAAADHSVGDDCGTAGQIQLGGVDDRPGHSGKPWGTFALPGGGWGGTWAGDGLSMCIVSMGNCRSSVQEHVEKESPLIVWEHQIMIDSAGAGEHRGGSGSMYTVSATAPTTATITGDRARIGPTGANGGGRGMPFYGWLIDDIDEAIADGALELGRTLPIFGIYDEEGYPQPDTGVFGQGTLYPTGKTTEFVLHPGQGVRLVVGGGGGWGDPLKRPTQKLREDIADGIYSPEFVERAYGVVFATDGEIDEEATARRRAELADARERGEWSVPTAISPNFTHPRRAERVSVEARA